MAKGQEIPVPMRGAIVTLRHVAKLPYGEIGLKTGINEASVKTLYHRIRARSGGPGSSLADLLNNLEDLPRSGRPRVPKAVAPASQPSPVRTYRGKAFDRTTAANHTRPSDPSASSCTIDNTMSFENATQPAVEFIPQYPPTTAYPILGYTPQFSPAMSAPSPELTAAQRETKAYYDAIYEKHRHNIPGYETHETAVQETVPDTTQAVASMPMSSSMAGRELSDGMLNSRASAGSPTAEQLEDTDDSDLEVELVGLPMESCDAVRRKIRAFLDNGEMKVGEFQNAIGTNSKAYSNFMTQNGPSKGAGSSVYQKAWRFFKLRELRGIKPPKHPSKPKKGEEGAAAAAAAPNLTAIELPGELDDKVPIYDTCDEVRRKINLHMKKPGVVQAQFLRDIAASYRKAPRKVQSTQLSKFRSKKGAWEGNTSVVFYGAYVFFEKMRIAEKKPKTKKRLEMENIYTEEGGVDTTSRHQYFSVLEGQRPHIDSYGRLNILD